MIQPLWKSNVCDALSQRSLCFLPLSSPSLSSHVHRDLSMALLRLVYLFMWFF